MHTTSSSTATVEGAVVLAVEVQAVVVPVPAADPTILRHTALAERNALVQVIRPC